MCQRRKSVTWGKRLGRHPGCCTWLGALWNTNKATCYRWTSKYQLKGWANKHTENTRKQVKQFSSSSSVEWLLPSYWRLCHSYGLHSRKSKKSYKQNRHWVFECPTGISCLRLIRPVQSKRSPGGGVQWMRKLKFPLLKPQTYQSILPSLTLGSLNKTVCIAYTSAFLVHSNSFLFWSSNPLQV